MSSAKPSAQLVDYTGAGAIDPARHAANLLVFTKNTRLEMKPELFSEIGQWSQARIYEELVYMANTIPSSWEFVNYTFMINNVTRAFTHQFVRTRTGSYAQQTMRVLNVDGWKYGTGPTLIEDFVSQCAYDEEMARIRETYKKLVENGVAIEDARGILPTNIHTNIVAKFDMRSLTDMFRKRASSRTQGEYREVIELMKMEVLRVHPWAELFLNRSFDIAAAELEDWIRTTAAHLCVTPTDALKLLDQMRATA